MLSANLSGWLFSCFDLTIIYNLIKLFRDWMIERKIKILEHEFKYYKKVYPKSPKVNRLKSKLYYYKKKLSNLR